ncbi:hypothetical protein AB6A40_007666 [Gnathostoma spinigerum]|uniref:peptidyl-tRNA hydrolase n=1 Tax=Gnathostoma spinigerum TaxID=75299 RepID=A0ABD6EWA2_9BILA
MSEGFPNEASDRSLEPHIATGETPPAPPDIIQQPLVSVGRIDREASHIVSDPTVHVVCDPSTQEIDFDPSRAVSDPQTSGPHNSTPPTEPTAQAQLPDIPRVSGFSTAELSRSAQSNPSDPVQLPYEVFSSDVVCNHPVDPQVSSCVDTALLTDILSIGFEEPIATLALLRTKAIGTLEAAVEWILDHSNASDSDLDEEEMGGVQSTALAATKSYKMAFVVNTSLKMGVGKLAAQVGHATLGVYRLAENNEQGQIALLGWKVRGEMKVVLKGHSMEQLLDLFKQAKDLDLFAYLVSDAGRTQIPAGSVTVLGIFGETEMVDQVTGSLKLL